MTEREETAVPAGTPDAEAPAAAADAQVDASSAPDDGSAPPEAGAPEDVAPEVPEDPRQPRRRFNPRPDVELPQGYRSSRRGSRALKQARKAAREQRFLRVWDKTRKTSANILWLIGMTLATIAIAGILLWAGAWAVNSIVRWNARRVAAQGQDSERERKSRENLLVIAVENDKPAGFLAMRYDGKAKQVYGVAIPDGAFIEVPGQGFERLGDSLAAGPDVAAAAVSNYFSVPFDRYVVVPAPAYQQALKNQRVSELLNSVSKTNVTPADLSTLKSELAEAPERNVALVPLPVKPIKLGSQTYFEPQRDEIADLLKTWWGVDITKASSIPRAIVYNGAGVPGIAGVAAQKLIRAGYRVVDTKNADRFNYKTTRIVVQRGDKTVGEKAKEVLGTGDVIVQPADQDVADIIVIIGKDFESLSGQ
ncbi:MAG: LytR C-terminal domain-containing protein [Coriobacteriales bacterium]|nr:LytR C-terminal domain-containing protein [Coriobacteriales bacterium]